MSVRFSMAEQMRKLRNSIGLKIRRFYHLSPDFMIVGAQKTGTTALHDMLVRHSAIVGPKVKEIHYFENDDWYAKQGSLDEYHNFFPLPHRLPANSIVLESTPIYLFHPKVPERLHRYKSDLKIIISLREPASRALSAWRMFHGKQSTPEMPNLHDPRSFREAIIGEMDAIESVSYYTDRKAYVRRGIYHDQIERYFALFPREQILILESNELRRNWDNCLRLITSFLGLPHEDIHQEIRHEAKVTGKEDFSEELSLLREFYEPYNERLYDLLGVRYDW